MGFFDFLKGKNRAEESTAPSPDFSGTDSQEKAEELARQGVLAPLYLMPLRFGGEESVSNRLFAPPAAVALKDRCDDMVEDLLRQGKVNGYECVPAYRDKSFVPVKVTVIAKMNGTPVFTESIQVWGD